MAIDRFEDLKSWQAARVLTDLVYAVTRRQPLAQDFRLRDQLHGAAISIMANIAEGFDCDSNLETIRFLGFARRSASEVQSLLYIALDSEYVMQSEFAELYGQAQKTKQLIGGFIRHLRTSQDPRKARR